MEKQIQNAKDWPRTYSAKFLTQGLVSYADSGAGIALLKQATIREALETFIGKPVILDHDKVTPENYEKYRKGNVIGCHFCPEDAWFYVDFIADDDEAVRCIEEMGYSVSCAYNVLDVAKGGTYQDIAFDGEITKISFTHLALVTHPRYEESEINPKFPAMLVNGKHVITEGGLDMFEIFKKKADGTKEKAEIIVAMNGKDVPLQEVLNSLADVLAKQNEKEDKQGNKENEKDEDKIKKGEEKTMAKDTDIVDVNGHSYSVGEIKNMLIKNAKDEEEKDVKKDKVKDSSEEEIEKAAKNSKENAKEMGDRFFAELKNASDKSDKEGLDEKLNTGSPYRGLSRTERAAKFAERTNKK